MRLSSVICVLLTLQSAFVSAAETAQPFPGKPIRWVVPFVPGGGVDVVMRPVAQRLSEAIGQPVVVDNRSGASGAVGAEIVAKAPADGYTLLAISSPPAVIAVLNREILKVLKVPDIGGRFAADGTDPIGSSAAEFESRIAREITKWRDITQKAGIRLE